MTHELKVLPAYFEAILDGRKTAEVRYNGDRGFQAGDEVVFIEYDGDKGYFEGNFSGRKILAKITYVFNYEQKENFVVFCFEKKGGRDV